MMPKLGENVALELRDQVMVRGRVSDMLFNTFNEPIAIEIDNTHTVATRIPWNAVQKYWCFGDAEPDR